MSLWSRIINVVRGDRLNREVDEELESHIEEAMEQGRDPAEVRRAFGSALRHREASRDAKLIVWLESLLADAIFGLRQLKKSRITSAAVGWLFAWWSAPFVVSRINPPDNPARVSLPADWRVFGFALALTLAVTFLFGLIPALRASTIKPGNALKGGDSR